MKLEIKQRVAALRKFMQGNGIVVYNNLNSMTKIQFLCYLR